MDSQHTHPKHLKRNYFLLVMCAVVVLSVNGCGNIPTPGVYKLDVQQGNVITSEMLSGLEPGMERRKVRFLLGTPLLTDTFNPDRWNYVYSFQESGGKRLQRHVVTIFENDLLLRVEGDVIPSEFATLPDVSPGRVVTVPDQEPDTLLGHVTDVFGDKDRLPLEEKPPEDDTTERFFDGVFGGESDDSSYGTTAANRDDATIVNPDAGQPDTSETASEPEGDANAEADTANTPETDGDEEAKDEIGFFERLSNEFGLEAPATQDTTVNR